MAPHIDDKFKRQQRKFLKIWSPYNTNNFQKHRKLSFWFHFHCRRSDNQGDQFFSLLSPSSPAWFILIIRCILRRSKVFCVSPAWICDRFFTFQCIPGTLLYLRDGSIAFRYVCCLVKPQKNLVKSIHVWSHFVFGHKRACEIPNIFFAIKSVCNNKKPATSMEKRSVFSSSSILKLYLMVVFRFSTQHRCTFERNKWQMMCTDFFLV